MFMIASALSSGVESALILPKLAAVVDRGKSPIAPPAISRTLRSIRRKSPLRARRERVCAPTRRRGAASFWEGGGGGGRPADIDANDHRWCRLLSSPP